MHTPHSLMFSVGIHPRGNNPVTEKLPVQISINASMGCKVPCAVRFHVLGDLCVVTVLKQKHLLFSVNQASGLGGTAVAGHNADQVETMKPVPERVIKVTFNADRHASMQWNFRPQQTEVFVSTSCYLGFHSGSGSEQNFSCWCLLGR